MTISKNTISIIPAKNIKLAELTKRLEALVSGTFGKTLEEFREENKNKVRQWIEKEEEEGDDYNTHNQETNDWVNRGGY